MTPYELIAKWSGSTPARRGRRAGPRVSKPTRCSRRGRREGAQEAHVDEPIQCSPAVGAAYGWSVDISDDEVLRELLALNGGGQ